MAAGEGKRLRPLTNDIPKPMVSVNGKPVLEYTLSILPEIIDEVILIVGYKKEKIIDYFGSTFLGKKLIYVEQTELNGTTGALRLAEPYLKDDYFLLLYADDLYHEEDLENCIQSLPTILAKEVPNPERFGVCLVDEKHLLTGMLEKVENPPSNLVNIGVYLLNKEIFDVPIEPRSNGELNLAEQIGEWAKSRPIQVIKARFWQPIAYPEDVLIAEEYLKKSLSERLN